jgi:hypothetical protein
LNSLILFRTFNEFLCNSHFLAAQCAGNDKFDFSEAKRPRHGTQPHSTWSGGTEIKIYRPGK